MPKSIVARLATTLVVTAASGCHDRLPTESAAPTAPHVSAVSTGPADAPFAHLLGVLPGETTSEATLVTDDGVVYGRSGARYFRWTEATGMQEVESIPAPAAYPIPAGAPANAIAANAHGEVTGGPPPYRWSASEGLRPLATAESQAPYANYEPFAGLAINRWGHIVARLAVCCGFETYMFWSPVDTFPIIRSSTNQVVLSDDDVVYTHEPLFVGDVTPTLRVRASSSHLVGRTLLLMPPTSVPDAPASPAGCSRSVPVPPLGVVATAANAQLSAVGYVYRPCTAYRRAVLWDLRPLERPRPLVSAPTPRTGRYGIPFEISYAFDPGYAGRPQSPGPWTVTVDWGDRTTTTDSARNPGFAHQQTHTYAAPGTYLVRFYVTDSQGAWGVAETTVTTTAPNEAPNVWVRPLVSGTVAAGTEFVVRGGFSDDSRDDGPWTFEMDWGSTTRAVASGLQPHYSQRGTEWDGDPIDFYYTFDTPGTYTFRYTVKDRYGAARTAVTTVEVVAR